MSLHGFTKFDRYNPCPICGRADGSCKLTDRNTIWCKRRDDPGEPVSGWVFHKLCSIPTWAIWHPENPNDIIRISSDFERGGSRQQEALRRRSQDQRQRLEDWLAEVGPDNVVPVHGEAFGRYRAMYPKFSPSTLAQLPAVFVAESPAYHGSLGMPEVDGSGKVIGYNFVWPSRYKESRGARGITVPARLAGCKPDQKMPTAVYEKIAITEANDWTIYVVEGASDVLAMAEMNLPAIGRCNNVGSVPELVAWVKNHLAPWRWNIVVLGENDLKPDGQFPGMDGAIRVSHGLADGLDTVIRWAMPPSGAKDVRDWLEQQSRRKGQPSPRTLGHELASHLAEVAHRVKPGDPLPGSPPPPTPEEIAAEQEMIRKLVEQIVVVTREHAARERSAESETARLISEARASHEHGMRCCRPRSIVLHDLETNGLRVQYVRCEDYVHCAGCRCWRVYREAANAAFRFHSATAPLYEMAVSADRWNAVRRRLNRLGGDYMRVHEDSCGSLYYVVTTAAHPDAIATTPQTALATVRHLLEEHDEQDRPVATSHGWKLPQAEQESDRYRRLGMGGRFLTMMALRQIAEAAGCHIALSKSPDSASRRVVACDLLRDSWTDEVRDWVASCLQAGEVLARLEHVEFNFKPQIDPSLDLLW